jgi:hypothetical protein
VKALVATLIFITLGPALASAQPRYQGLGKAEAAISNQRLRQAPSEIQRLISALGSRVTIKPSQTEIGGGYYTETIFGSGPDRYVVQLRRQSLRKQTPFYRHMYWHEFGHVLINAYFSQSHFLRTVRLLERSPDWSSCFLDPTNPIPDSCVPEEEIVADQIAFWITKKYQTRSPRNIPVLFNHRQFRAQVIAPLVSRHL